MGDRELGDLLREWKVGDAPASLEERVLGRKQPWWRFLLTGSIRVPVPLAAAAVVMAAVALWPARTPATAASLKDFRPIDQPVGRIIHVNP
jgi:hypothetical protein